MFANNLWVYYSAITVVFICWLLMYAFKFEYSIIDITSEAQIRRSKTVRTFALVMIGYIVFWAAIRNGVVDTAQYIQSYELLDMNLSFKQIFFSNSEGNFESKAPMFVLYQLILRKLGFDFHVYLGSIAVFSGICILYGITKYSDDIPFSCYLFITMLQFYWLFNGIRQYIVVSIVFATFHLIVEKKLFRFLLIVFLLYFIHKTAIMLIPIYLIVNLKNWSFGIYGFILATFIVVFAFPGLVTQLLDRAFDEYDIVGNFETDDGVNPLRVLVSFFTPGLAFIYKNKISEYDNPYINVMINMSLITAGLYLVGMVTSGVYVGRLPAYTEIFNIILLPFIIKKVLPNNIKGVVFGSAVVLYFIYFHVQARQGMYYTTDLIKGMDLREGMEYY